MKNKKKNLTGVIASVLLLIVFITASFAYFGMFTVNLENKVAVNIHANSIGNTSFIATSANLNVIVPISGMFKGNTGLAAENTATLTVNLTGAEGVVTTCTYDVVYEYNLDSEIYGSTVNVTSGATKEITMQVDSPSGTNNYSSETNFAYDSSWTPKTTTVGAKKTLVKNATITSEGTSVVQKINITGKYYNLDLDQAQLGNKAFTGTIYVENNNCSVGEKPAYLTILANNNVNETSPTFSTTPTTNEGLYKANDDQGISYYFRGKVDNNWVKFGKYISNGPAVIDGDGDYYGTMFDDMASCEEYSSGSSNSTSSCYNLWETGDDMYWRIIRINGDGSIRLIYAGNEAPTEEDKVSSVNRKQVISFIRSYNKGYNDRTIYAEYGGYMYEVGKQHGLAISSNVKDIVDSWYQKTSFLTTNNSLIADNPFCNDRSAATIGSDGNLTEYGEITNWVSSGTMYTFRGLQNNFNEPSLHCLSNLDRFTVSASNGNGALTYPAGIITADEVKMAGDASYLNIGFEYYTMTPMNSATRLFFVNGNGALANGEDERYTIRPVISISKDVKLSGDGTWNNPYVVEG